MLCAWCKCREGGKKDWLQLWMVGNYHWYLKQEIELAPSKDGIPNSFVGVLWDPVVPLKLHLLTAGEDRELDYFASILWLIQSPQV